MKLGWDDSVGYDDILVPPYSELLKSLQTSLNISFSRPIVAEYVRCFSFVVGNYDDEIELR